MIAGTDTDGDNLICDPGEACGAFPTTETVVPITVDRTDIGLRFLTGFDGAVRLDGGGGRASDCGYSREIGGVSPDH